jgi:hypothetical protein
VGVLKEIYDATLKPAPHKRGASWKDLAADIPAPPPESF